MGVIILQVGFYRMKKVVYEEVKNELKILNFTIKQSYEEIYPGDYTLLNPDYFVIGKGDVVLTGNNSYIDKLKIRTDTEISLFFGDVRFITTIKDANSNRAVNTKANTQIVESVIEGKKEGFYESVDIFGEKFFAYYSPIKNSNNDTIGMIGIAKPANEVDKMIFDALIPLGISIVVIILISLLFVTFYANDLIRDIKKIDKSLKNISGGNLNGTAYSGLLSRNDELGEIGNRVRNMQNELKNLIELDPLTNLYNRGTGNKRFRKVYEKAREHGTNFVVVIGDIDKFKGVNDTYGHDAGDLILKNVAKTLKKNMPKQSFVCRWGGEEFLMIFDEYSLDAAYDSLLNIKNEILELTVEYLEWKIKVSMTFGMAKGNVEKSMEELIKIADKKLYYGKENGRNQIVK